VKYKLINGSANDINNIARTVLNNRGIHDINGFLNVNKTHCLSYELLDNIGEAVQCMVKHIENKSNIHIVVDSDADGFCSAAMVYQYLIKCDPSLYITYSIHIGKQHGLSEDIVIPNKTNLIVLPDAGSNDYEQHKLYKEKGSCSKHVVIICRNI
jgi:single-stranded-DNA-specific exonuclease